MITATVLAVFFVPVFFMAIQWLIEMFSDRFIPPPGLPRTGRDDGSSK